MPIGSDKSHLKCYIGVKLSYQVEEWDEGLESISGLPIRNLIKGIGLPEPNTIDGTSTIVMV